MSDVTTREPGQVYARERSMSKAQEGEGSPWDVEVDVYLESVSPLHFRIESYLQPQANGDLVFHNRGHDGFNVNFHLHDLTDGGYQFAGPPNLNQAIWSQIGDVCPTSGVWQVFDPKQVKDHGMTLVAYNKNPAPAQGHFMYTLNVTNNNGTSYVALDPGGNNMNGSSNA